MKGGEGVKTVALLSKDFSKKGGCLNSSVILRSDNSSIPSSKK